ncbi:MAG: alpha/beta hydrolase, partial [Spirochaetaceae bacterium]|nr:alpha/beta hydrolase [Spirochaetaceae bacterium]
MTNILELKKQKGLVSEERYIARKDGTSLRVCVYTSPQTQPGAVGVLWIHGGGYAIGVPELDMQYYQKLLHTTNCVIISPDYTLSPSKPYPVALDDCYSALLWMKEHASELGIRDDQLFVAGNSAG